LRFKLENDEREGSRIHPRYQPAGTHDINPVVDQTTAETYEGLRVLTVNAGATA
jgi:hypothetical protein